MASPDNELFRKVFRLEVTDFLRITKMKPKRLSIIAGISGAIVARILNNENFTVGSADCLSAAMQGYKDRLRDSSAGCPDAYGHDDGTRPAWQAGYDHCDTKIQRRNPAKAAAE